MIILTRYKCHVCKYILEEEDLNGNLCPACGIAPVVMCELDHCGCHHEITSGSAYCPECGEAVCPICNCHDVEVISRVTGYMQDVRGWNAGKQQELKDRHRISL